MSSCASLRLWPQDACGYGGYCNESYGMNVFCTCKEGFGDVGHLQLLPGRHCNIPMKGTETLWLLCLCLSIASLLLRVVGLFIEFNRPRYVSKRMNIMKIGMVMDISNVVVASILYYRPDKLLGRDLTVIVAVNINMVLYFTSALYTMSYFIHVAFRLLDGKEQTKANKYKLNKLVQRMTVLVFIGAVIFCTIPLLGLYVLGAEYTDFFAKVFCLGLVIIWLVFDHFFFFRILTLFENQIEKKLLSDDGDSSVEIIMKSEFCKKLSRFQRNAKFVKKHGRRFAHQNAILFTIIAFWPLARSYLPVLIPWILFTGAIGNTLGNIIMFNPASTGELAVSRSTVVPARNTLSDETVQETTSQWSSVENLE